MLYRSDQLCKPQAHCHGTAQEPCKFAIHSDSDCIERWSYIRRYRYRVSISLSIGIINNCNKMTRSVQSSYSPKALNKVCKDITIFARPGNTYALAPSCQIERRGFEAIQNHRETSRARITIACRLGMGNQVVGQEKGQDISGTFYKLLADSMCIYQVPKPTGIIRRNPGRMDGVRWNGSSFICAANVDEDVSFVSSRPHIYEDEDEEEEDTGTTEPQRETRISISLFDIARPAKPKGEYYLEVQPYCC